LAAGSLKNETLLTNIKGVFPFSIVAVPSLGTDANGVKQKGTSAGKVPFFYCFLTRNTGGLCNAR
jgi:hypothetical protein